MEAPDYKLTEPHRVLSHMPVKSPLCNELLDFAGLTVTDNATKKHL